MIPKIKSIDVNTEQKILESARNIFHKKGLSGSRMQEIADKAGINKAMLHYYYSSKDKLFDAVFQEAIKRIFPELSKLLNEEMPLFEKIIYFSDKYISLLQQNVYLPSFVMNEMNQNPERFKKSFLKNVNIKPDIFIAQIKKGIKDNEHLVVKNTTKVGGGFRDGTEKIRFLSKLFFIEEYYFSA